MTVKKKNQNKLIVIHFLCIWPGMQFCVIIQPKFLLKTKALSPLVLAKLFFAFLLALLSTTRKNTFHFLPNKVSRILFPVYLTVSLPLSKCLRQLIITLIQSYEASMKVVRYTMLQRKSMKHRFVVVQQNGIFVAVNCRQLSFLSFAYRTTIREVNANYCNF